ncbi:MAG TPA: right-handed parallel beta-helix repeat-containing protein, partial [Pirellulaceae bacterium]
MRGSSREFRRRLRRAAARCRRVFLEPLEDRRLLALTITVNSNADIETPDNFLTLREAIDISNGTLLQTSLTAQESALVVDTPGSPTNAIQFSISTTGGLQTINLSGPLPTIANPVTIDGYTEPGALRNTSAIDDPDPALRGFNGKLLIEINGANVTGGNGLTIAVPNGNVKISGLVINRFHGNGTPGQGNGILVQQSNGVFLAGNFLGTDSTGSTSLGNDRGIFVNASPTTIGGTTPADRNVISGNNLQGVQLAAVSNTVQGNLIGTSSSGKSAVPNGGDGILVTSAANTIGGPGGARNVVSGNKTNGINLFNATSTTVQGNLIGTDVSGSLAAGNQQIGIRLENASKTNISNNTVAFNGPATVNPSISGIVVLSGVGNLIEGNSIFNNSNLGIDLAPFGAAANDPDDSDTGANNLQNFPEISTVSLNSGTLAVNYLVPSATASSAYPLHIEFFKADSAGQEGQQLLATDSYTTATAGTATVFTTNVPAGTPLQAGDFIVATATDAAGNTSEFSPGIVIPPTTALHSPQVENGVTYINTQSSSGLTIAPDPADGTTVRFFK